MDGQTDMTKLTGAVRNFVDSPKNDRFFQNLDSIVLHVTDFLIVTFFIHTFPASFNRTNTPINTETEQYTYIQSPAPEDECNNIRNMLSNKKLS